MTRYLVITLYEFRPVADPATLVTHLRRLTSTTEIRGLLIVAAEGINGTLAGPETQVRELVAWLRETAGFVRMNPMETWAEDKNPFVSLKVQLRDETVTLGKPGIHPHEGTGVHVRAQQWNALMANPDVLLMDVRNDYECAIGSFPGAQQPHTETFGAFAEWVEDHGPQLEAGGPIAMFCTGGIRCEKASAYLLSLGYGPVFQLEGGILKYLEQIPDPESRWVGECYVFDGRVSLDEDLQPGRFTRCPACRHPIDETDRAHPDFEAGRACARCTRKTTDAQKNRFGERHRQIRLARDRGEQHRVVNTGCP